MLHLIVALALAAGATTRCAAKGPGDVVTEQSVLDIGGGRHLWAVSVADGDASGDEAPATRVTIHADDCRDVFEQSFTDANQTRFDDVKLGAQHFLVVTTYGHGGSSCHYQHVLLTYPTDMSSPDGGDDVTVMTPMTLSHNNMDGFYLGDLGAGRGPGLALWEALWDRDGAHYDPHRYKLTTYKWLHGRFYGPSVAISRRKYEPSPDEAARGMGLPFRDMTRQERFGGC